VRREPAGRLDDARRMRALSSVLLEAYPGRTEPILILCEAYFQDSKNAWSTNDLVAFRRSIRQSLDAAIRAAAIDPASNEAHRLIVDRTHRLNGLEADSAKSR
jgi:hypothetical protein